MQRTKNFPGPPINVLVSILPRSHNNFSLETKRDREKLYQNKYDTLNGRGIVKNDLEELRALNQSTDLLEQLNKLLSGQAKWGNFPGRKTVLQALKTEIHQRARQQAELLEFHESPQSALDFLTEAIYEVNRIPTKDNWKSDAEGLTKAIGELAEYYKSRAERADIRASGSMNSHWRHYARARQVLGRHPKLNTQSDFLNAAADMSDDIQFSHSEVPGETIWKRVRELGNALIIEEIEKGNSRLAEEIELQPEELAKTDKLPEMYKGFDGWKRLVKDIMDKFSQYRK